MKKRAEIVVRGLVQGVGFRWFTRERAELLSLKGYVKNQSDGTVFIEVEGAEEEIERLIREVKRGPRYAAVKDVKVLWHTDTRHFASFDIT